MTCSQKYWQHDTQIARISETNILNGLLELRGHKRSKVNIKYDKHMKTFVPSITINNVILLNRPIVSYCPIVLYGFSECFVFLRSLSRASTVFNVE